jgi:hypothetical protein
MRRSIGTLAAMGALLGALPTALAAQGARVWGGMGVGTAYASVECVECGGAGTGWETTVTASVGRTLGPRIRLGLEGTGWHRATLRDDDDLENATEGFALNAGLRYYPIRGAGLHLRSGAGVGLTQRYSVVVGDSLRWYDVGPSATVGIGYDLALGRSWALVPYANAIGMLTFSLRSNVEHSRRPGWIDVGVALERH